MPTREYFLDQLKLAKGLMREKPVRWGMTAMTIGAGIRAATEGDHIAAWAVFVVGRSLVVK